MNGLGQSMEPFPLPTFCRQRRSHVTRPRPSPDIKEGFAGVTTSSSSEIVQGEETVQCATRFDNGGQAESSNSQIACQNGFPDQLDKERHLSSHTAEAIASYLPPGTVVWAKTNYHECWPAEVMDGRTILQCCENQFEGLVLVQLYGVWEYAWVDPVNDLAQFDDGFEERSKYSSRAFQDALNHAVRHRKMGSLCEHSDENSDKWNPKIHSSNVEEDLEHQGKGKRARKPRLHFDDLEFPDNSVRRVRRMKIMRHLGLMAPAGSPFHQGHKGHQV